LLLTVEAIFAAEGCRKFQCAPGGVIDQNDHSICAKKEGGVTIVGSCGNPASFKYG